jgi:S-adenosylmethionine synthetase
MKTDRSRYLFTSESVSEGHPDKVADRISDTVVDAFLSADPYARVACETLVTTNLIVLAGEVRGPAGVIDSLEPKVRQAVKDIGYEQDGFHWQNARFDCHLHGQSADIAIGVDAAGNKDEGAGDQGIMFGYATAETPELMPATLQYSHNILHSLAAARHKDRSLGLEPDAKSQVTLVYENGRPVHAASIVLSTQHRDGLTPADIFDIVRPYVMAVFPEGLVDDQTHRQLRDRRSGRRLRSDRPQDHRRHLRRRGAAWRGGLFRQGPDQGRPLGGLRLPLPGQERGGRRPRAEVHDSDRLCHRRLPAAQLLCRPARG